MKLQNSIEELPQQINEEKIIPPLVQSSEQFIEKQVDNNQTSDVSSDDIEISETQAPSMVSTTTAVVPPATALTEEIIIPSQVPQLQNSAPSSPPQQQQPTQLPHSQMAIGGVSPQPQTQQQTTHNGPNVQELGSSYAQFFQTQQQQQNSLQQQQIMNAFSEAFPNFFVNGQLNPMYYQHLAILMSQFAQFSQQQQSAAAANNRPSSPTSSGPKTSEGSQQPQTTTTPQDLLLQSFLMQNLVVGGNVKPTDDMSNANNANSSQIPNYNPNKQRGLSSPYPTSPTTSAENSEFPSPFPPQTPTAQTPSSISTPASAASTTATSAERPTKKRRITSKTPKSASQTSSQGSSSGSSTPRGSRDDSSLRLLTKRFVDLIAAAEDGILDLNKASDHLKVQKRRIYDITNVLEGIGLIDKKSKNNIQWKGTGIAVSTTASSEDSEEVKELQQEIDALSLEEREIDAKIEFLQQKQKTFLETEDYKRNAFVSYNDLKQLEQLKDRTVTAIRAPPGTTLQVPDPEQNLQNTDSASPNPVSGPRKYQIFLHSPTDPIKIFLLSDERSQAAAAAAVAAQAANQTSLPTDLKSLSDTHTSSLLLDTESISHNNARSGSAQTPPRTPTDQIGNNFEQIEIDQQEGENANGLAAVGANTTAPIGTPLQQLVASSFNSAFSSPTRLPVDEAAMNNLLQQPHTVVDDALIQVVNSESLADLYEDGNEN